jgi:single-stranded-DNA-specific exonuclease
MEKGGNRILDAIKNKEKIAILGDYDVDGLSSIVLLREYFKFFNIEVFSYIPDRITEGYGPNKKAIDKIKSEKTSLLIMLDCGTNSHDIISYVFKNKIDLIIIDHHKSNEKHSDELILINPNTIFDNSKYNFVCTAGLVFIFLFFIQKLIKKINLSKKIPNLTNYLDLVALATVCDVVPLIDINRTFVFQGLKILSKRSNLGLKVLADEGQLNKKPDEEDLGFFFGPRINAGGRIGIANIGEQLLISNDEKHAEKLVKQLNTLNYQRKLIEDKVFEEALEKIYKEKKNKYKSLFIFRKDWHEGVLGIVASRLKEKFNKPVIILTRNKKIFKGSCRSILGIDIGLLILKAKQKKIIVNGGGHQMAAGLSINEENLNLFQTFFEEYVKENKSHNNKSFFFDETISLNAINDELIDSINNIAPYGLGNPKPKFLFTNLKIIKPNLVGETKKHLSFFITDGIKTIKAIIFYAMDSSLGNSILSNYNKTLFSFIGSVKRSLWKNKVYFETIIEDVIIEKDII